MATDPSYLVGCQTALSRTSWTPRTAMAQAREMTWQQLQMRWKSPLGHVGLVPSHGPGQRGYPRTRLGRRPECCLGSRRRSGESLRGAVSKTASVRLVFARTDVAVCGEVDHGEDREPEAAVRSQRDFLGRERIPSHEAAQTQQPAASYQTEETCSALPPTRPWQGFSAVPAIA